MNGCSKLKHIFIMFVILVVTIAAFILISSLIFCSIAGMDTINISLLIGMFLLLFSLFVITMALLGYAGREIYETIVSILEEKIRE